MYIVNNRFELITYNKNVNEHNAEKECVKHISQTGKPNLFMSLTYTGT